MVGANLLIAGVTGYFFWRILTSGPPDAADEQDANFPRGG